MNDIPKTVFDKEYSTQWKREVEFLNNKGIKYTYVKKHYKYPVSTYKYTKTPELFLALAEFYNQVRIQKFFKDVETTNSNMALENGYIAIKKDDLTEPEKLLIKDQEIVDLIDDTE